MTPAARVQAAIEVLDRIDQGMAAEKALTNWARGARFAGSGDRAAVRDHVYQALRCWASCAALGGAATGRGRMIGLLRAKNQDIDFIFNGLQYAPDVLSEAERAAGAVPTGDQEWDLPGWLANKFRAAFGADQGLTIAQALRGRAPVMLRVNLRKGDVQSAQAALAEDKIKTAPHPIADTALIALEGVRRIKNSAPYTGGLVELQDGSSQAAMKGLNLTGAARLLDYCAGGGGKALALAARSDAAIFAHDIDPARMADLAPRAARAGVQITPLATRDLTRQPPFDLVLCDAPCSGSGTWRRSPEAKWRLTPERLKSLMKIQAEVLRSAAPLVRHDGQLIYATCSVLPDECDAQVDGFLAAHPGWSVSCRHSFDVSDGGDGFFVAHLRRD